MLEARKLLCERDERVLFSDLSFQVNAGEWIQVTGGNGAGKTTLLRLLTGLSRPDAGEVCWQEQQQRRVALARLWLTRATLWILDEPFTAIDVNGVERLTQRMAQHTEEGGIVILTTHQPMNVATDRIRRIALTLERAGQ